MKYLDQTWLAPAENLACDEVLLDWCEQADIGPVLRCWQPSVTFVVAGYGNQLHQEIYLDACTDHGIPVFRRCSGGGTVLQGPGVLNYCLVLPTSEADLSSVTLANCHIMRRHRDALQSCVQTGIVRVQGHTDLTWNGLKFSGNSQRRKRQYFLFHGTFLLHMDLAQVSRFLGMPTRQPDYRLSRGHESFLTNLGVEPARVKKALIQCWNATDPLTDWPETEVPRLAARRYGNPDWTFKRSGYSQL